MSVSDNLAIRGYIVCLYRSVVVVGFYSSGGFFFKGEDEGAGDRCYIAGGRKCSSPVG